MPNYSYVILSNNILYRSIERCMTFFECYGFSVKPSVLICCKLSTTATLGGVFPCLTACPPHVYCEEGSSNFSPMSSVVTQHTFFYLTFITICQLCKFASNSFSVSIIATMPLTLCCEIYRMKVSVLVWALQWCNSYYWRIQIRTEIGERFIFSANKYRDHVIISLRQCFDLLK